MTRLRNKASGVVVNVDDATAAALGSAWEPADKSAKQAKRRVPKRDDENDDE